MSVNKGKKGRAKRLLLRGDYYNVPTPYGVRQVNCEVWLHVETRVDSQGDPEHGTDEVGGDDVLGDIIQKCSERIADICAARTRAAATTERIVQIELFEGLEGG